ncbi:MAG: Gfo/Idh/MocA family protein, partial [Phycisphaerae bacterium]
MNKKTVRSGIIGSGFAAKFHFECIRRVASTDIQIEGVFDINTKQGASYAKKRRIRAYDSLEELLDKVDVIHVCTPPVVHEQIAIAALRQDKFAILEKPLTGYFGDGSEDFNGDRFRKRVALDKALASIQRMLKAEKKS